MHENVLSGPTWGINEYIFRRFVRDSVQHGQQRDIRRSHTLTRANSGDETERGCSNRRRRIEEEEPPSGSHGARREQVRQRNEVSNAVINVISQVKLRDYGAGWLVYGVIKRQEIDKFSHESGRNS